MTAFTHNWIEHNNPQQLTWIQSHLARNGVLVGQLYPPDPVNPMQARTEVIAFLDRGMDDANFRERYRKMQAAWRQQKMRHQPHRHAVTFQLHKETSDLLTKLAKKRGKTKVTVLEEMIREAWTEYGRADKEMREAHRAYKEKLDEQRKQHQEKERASQQIIDTLLDALAENLDQRCRWQATFNEDAPPPLEEAEKTTYQALLDERLKPLEVPSQARRRLGLKNTLRRRVEALTAPQPETEKPPPTQ